MKNFRTIILILAGLLSVAWTSPRHKIFLIGDSISLHYGPYLKKYLSGIAQLDRKQDDGQAAKNLDVPLGANGGDSRMVLRYLKSKLEDPEFNPDFLLLNCGLHDIKRDPKTNHIQVNAVDYRSNLTEIARLVASRGIQLVWMRSTWVVDSIHNLKSGAFKRYDVDVRKYNAIADEVCLQNNIPVIDLYGFTKQLGVEQFIDHAHYSEYTRALQAAYIFGFFQNILSGND